MRRSYLNSAVSAAAVAAVLAIAPVQFGSAVGFTQALAAVAAAGGKQPANHSHSPANFNRGTKDAGGQPNSQVDQEKVEPYVPH